MNDKIVYDPTAFSVADLLDYARGTRTRIAPGIAAHLLSVKAGPEAHAALIDLIRDSSADPRGRSAAIRALASDVEVAPMLPRLAREQTVPLVASTAQLLLDEQSG